MSTTKKPKAKLGLSATKKSEMVADLFPNSQDEVPKELYRTYSPNGRPTKFSAHIIKKTYEYINLTHDEFYNYQKSFGATDTYERRVIANIVTLDGLALHLKIHRDTVHDWSKKYRSFSDALDILTAVQKVQLINRTASGDYNAVLGKLMLSSNHGMKDRSDNTTDDQPLPPAVTINNIKHLSDEQLIELTKGSAGRASK